MVLHDNDLAGGVDDERAAFSEAVLLNHDVEVAGEDAGLVAEHRELNLADGFGGFLPGLVREVRIGGDGVDLNAELPELFVVFGEVFEFRRADEREVGRIEEDDGPVALQVSIGNLLEGAVVISLGLKREDFSRKKRHLKFLKKWN